MPENKPDKKNEEIRIGVYTCYCGGNISDAVDVEVVAKTLGGMENVVVSRTDMSMCSNAGQAKIEEDIREHGVNRVVVGACAPSLHEKTFRTTVARAGLNPYLYQHAGIREQASWVHHAHGEKASLKAVRIMNAAIAKARELEELSPISLDAKQHAMVIGGGVAGIRAALEIANRGLHATIIEKSPFLGGRMARLEKIFPTGENARESLHKLIDKVVAHPNITIYTGAELTNMHGSVGDFNAEVTVQMRGVSGDFTDFEAAANACPVEVPDEFNYGLTTRKAIYQPYENTYPNMPAIDWANCTLCGECQKVSRSGLHLENEPQVHEIHVGAIVVATGFKPYEPREGEYGFGEMPEVVTLPQMVRLIAMNEGSDAFVYNGREVKNLAFIHCVGSREIPGVHEPQEDGKVNDHCSRYCCTATLHVANEIHEAYPDIDIFDIYEDIRTYGRGHEKYYIDASHHGVRFLRFHGNDRAEVKKAEAGDTVPALIQVTDHLTWGKELEVPADLVVLATGMLPNPVEDIIRLLKINAGVDRFLAEIHPKLRPVETSVPGVILAGTAQGPMNIQESVAAASAAAAKVSVLLGTGSVELDPFIAAVNLDLCDGNGVCVEVCHYEGAISVQDVNGAQKAVVNPGNCVGCGVCVGACPNNAVDIKGWTISQYDSMLDALMADVTLEVGE